MVRTQLSPSQASFYKSRERMASAQSIKHATSGYGNDARKSTTRGLRESHVAKDAALNAKTFHSQLALSKSGGNFQFFENSSDGMFSTPDTGLSRRCKGCR